jgi:4-amino-4-deoxy-L-arabinose transferase-like glycosyltransferase
MAKTLAETGRFAYNGWPTAMLGIQVWWGAAWVWLFGFSFTIVRLSVLPLALGAVALVYLIARRASLSPSDSLFVALATGLSPNFITLTPTFMSDVPALFFLMASLYGFVRAVETASQVPARTRDTLAWLALGMLCGVLGGTVRQTVWFAPLAGAAVLFLWPGVGSRLRLSALLCGVVGLACIVVGVRWFNSQPYAIPIRTTSLATYLSPTHVGSTVRTVGVIVVGAASSIMPVIAFQFPALRRWRLNHVSWIGRSWAVDVAIVATLLLVVFDATVRGVLAHVGQSLGAVAAMQACILIFRGGRIVILVGLAFAAMLVVFQRRATVVSAVRRFPPALVVPLAYLMLYSVALLQASNTTGAIFGRYFLHYVPILACVLLWSDGAPSKFTIGSPRSVWGWVFLVTAAVCAIDQLHDRFAGCRARLTAIDFLTSKGIPRDRIMAGWEIDGWEQIEREGTMNDSRIRVPPGAFQPFQPDGYPEDLFIRKALTALTPEYIVTVEPTLHPGDGTKFPTFPYTSWRPPFHREVVICHQTPTQADDQPGPSRNGID